MTVLANGPVASGLTMRPLPRPALSTVDAAERFFVSTRGQLIRRLTIQVPGTEPWSRPWFVEYVEAELNELLGLGEGWDGRRAGPITDAAVQGTIDVLAALMNETSAPPQLFPLPDGGLQVEWHVGGNDIEVEIDAGGEAHVLAETADGATVAEGVVHRGEIDARLVAARDFLQRLSARLGRVPVGV